MVKKVKSGMDFKSAMKRPFQDTTKLIIGCALNIVPIVNFLATGYVLKSGKLTLNKKNDLPEWTDWGNLFIMGLLAAVIGLIWMIPAIVVAVIGGGAAIASLVTAGATGATGLGVGGLAGAGVLLVIAALLALIAAYFAPLAVLGYVDKGNFGDGFDFSTIFKKAFTGDYAIAWLLTGVVAIVLGTVAGIIPYVNFILSPAASFISMMIGITLIGSVYRNL
ncbi:DUF4013 domain-containing protein [archaeon]|jgi:hypothetical protein|nr:DUF4013 domain-containing protein [archaeon]MBT4396983.1 DUF4013 domain-containing protein [archaeon]MBT4440974.1 DUF4013 domain-containing protein [archaeon]